MRHFRAYTRRYALALLFSLLTGCGASPSTSVLPAPTIAILAPAPTLGVVVNPQMRVLSIDIASPAETAGIQPGDQLETLDRIAFASNIQNVKEHIFGARKDQAMQLRLRRGAMSLEVVVVPVPSYPRSRPTLEASQSVPTASPVAPTDVYL